MFAEDADKGDLGIVSYNIMYEALDPMDFNITADTGRVETAIRLNYETVSSYVLEIQAIDMDPDVGTRR